MGRGINIKRILRVALRDFVAVVCTKGFIIGALSVPAMIAAMFILGPRFLRMLKDPGFQIEGEYAVMDPTGLVFPEMNRALDPEAVARRRLEAFRRRTGQASGPVRDMVDAAVERSMNEMLGPAPRVRLIALPADTDIEAEKAWLKEASGGLRHTALIVIHENAVEASGPESGFGTYDLYVAPDLDERDLGFIYRSIREAIVNARISAHSLEQARIKSLVRVPRQRSITVRPDGERQTVGSFNIFLPAAFGLLMFMGIMAGGQTLLTSTVEEKSSRVVEVLLSAVSPMELMAGKLIGGVAISLVMMGFYILTGMAVLTSLSLFDLFDPWLILYLLIFFLIGFFAIGALMLAVGAAVNEMSEAGPLMTPLVFVTMVPWLLWPLVSRSPNSTLAIFFSYLPPINSFGMLMRMASSQPPPWWQVWLSIGVGVASVVGAVWVAAKVFRIGLLMYGKPPNLKTLIRWVRAA